MKILMYDNSHLPKVGGKEVVVHQLASWYQRLGHEVLLVGPGGPLRNRRFDFGYPVKRFLSLPGISKEMSWRWQLRLANLQFKHDVIHAHTTYPCAYTAAKVMASHKQSTPLIVTPHGNDIHKIPEIDFGQRLDPVRDEQIGWALRKCDYATAISTSVEASLIDAGMVPERIVSIPNGVDALRFQAEPQLDIYEYLGIPANSQIVVSVGNYHPRKGHEYLVEAAMSLAPIFPRLKVVIVGAKNKRFEKSLVGTPAADVVRFTGPLGYPIPGVSEQPDVLAALHRQSCAYVSSSVGEGSEGLSLALLESMAARCCIVATKVSGNRDVIRSNENGLLVEPGSASELAAVLRWVLEHPDEAKSLGEQAATSIKDYLWENIAAQYLKLFERTIAGQKSSALAA